MEDPFPTTSPQDLDGLTTTIHSFGLRFLEYDLNNMIIDRQALKSHCPLSPSTQAGEDFQQRLGNFAVCPQEVLFNILNNIDIETIASCLTISKDSRTFVDSSPTWRAVKDNAPNVLRALLSTGLASFFTLADVFDAFCRKACFVCGKFGAFLDILSCQRCCWTCIKTAKELCPITPAYAVAAYGLSEDTMDTIPQIHTLPGTYSVTRKYYTNRTVLLREQAAWEAGTRQHGSEEALKEYMRTSDEFFLGDGRKAFRREWESTSEELRHEIPLPRCPNTADLQMWNPDRFMSIIEFPSFNSSTGEVEDGVACSACVVAHFYGERRESGSDHTVMFTKSSYLDHFKECPKSQKHWAEKLAERRKAKAMSPRPPRIMTPTTRTLASNESSPRKSATEETVADETAS